VNIGQQTASAASQGEARQWGLAGQTSAMTAALALSGPALASARASGPRPAAGPTSGVGAVQITWIASTTVPIRFDQTVSVPVPVNSLGVQVHLLRASDSRVTSYRIISQPNHGFLDSRNFAAGTFTYVPRPGYSGTDTLTYQDMHGNAPSARTTVTFTVGLTA